jgi:hypothetical protein
VLDRAIFCELRGIFAVEKCDNINKEVFDSSDVPDEILE